MLSSTSPPVKILLPDWVPSPVTPVWPNRLLRRLDWTVGVPIPVEGRFWGSQVGRRNRLWIPTKQCKPTQYCTLSTLILDIKWKRIEIREQISEQKRGCPSQTQARKRQKNREIKRKNKFRKTKTSNERKTIFLARHYEFHFLLQAPCAHE